MKRMLNAGCADTHLENLPEGWTEVTLDIDERYSPDIVADLRDLSAIEDKEYDAIYASHVIEHVYAHEVIPMLKSFARIVTEHAHIRTPDLGAIAIAISQGCQLTQPLYRSPAGPITPLDLLYGYTPHIAKVSEWYAHKCLFTREELYKCLKMAGFNFIEIYAHDWELEAIARFRRPLEIVDRMPAVPLRSV